MRICRTLTNLLPIFVVVDGSSLMTGAAAAAAIGRGGVTFAVDIGINFFMAVDGGVVAASLLLLFVFDLMVTKLVNDVCKVGFFVVVGVLAPVDAAPADGVDAGDAFSDAALTVGNTLLDRVLIADLSSDDATFGGRDFLSVAAADAAARVVGKRTFTDVTLAKPNGFGLFSGAAA